MSLAAKIDEVKEFFMRNSVDIGLVTKTWLSERIADSMVDITNFNMFRKDRSTQQHGVVCMYVNKNINYETQDNLNCCDAHEMLWVKLKPSRLPRGFSSLFVAAVYYPPGAYDKLLCDHIFQIPTTTESSNSNCGIVIGGDFNRLDTKYIQRHFKLKQVVKSPTRGDAILDLILTNLQNYYSPAEILPPFGLSDYNTVLLKPKMGVKKVSTKKSIMVRDTTPSNKASLCCYLTEIDWSVIDNERDCTSKLELFMNLSNIGINLLTPQKQIRIDISDTPWMTEKLKALIGNRKKVFLNESRHSLKYKFYRNAVNRERKDCKSRFYKSRIQDVKGEQPMVWWKEIKQISGMKCRGNDLLNQLIIDQLKDQTPQQKAYSINDALLQPLEDYKLHSPLAILPLGDNPTFLQVSEGRVLNHLLKPSKG